MVDGLDWSHGVVLDQQSARCSYRPGRVETISICSKAAALRSVWDRQTSQEDLT